MSSVIAYGPRYKVRYQGNAIMAGGETAHFNNPDSLAIVEMCA